MAFSDLPETLSVDVEHVFDVDARIPTTWLDEVLHPNSVGHAYTHRFVPGIIVFAADEGAVPPAPRIFARCSFFMSAALLRCHHLQYIGDAKNV